MGGYNIIKSFKIIKICRKVIFLKKLLLGIFSLGIIMFAHPGEVGKNILEKQMDIVKMVLF